MKRLPIVIALVLGLVAPATAQGQACEDTQAPIAPQVTSLLAVSGTQAWPEWSDSTYLDLGPVECRANGVTSGVLVYQPGSPYSVAGTHPFIDSHGIRNGARHEALTDATLAANTTYTARAWAMDADGNASHGNEVSFTTPAHYGVVVAGQVKQAGSSTGVVTTLAVSATKVGAGGWCFSGTYPCTTITDGHGIYRLPLPANSSNEDWDVTYGPGCFFCGSNVYGPVTDRVTVGSVLYPPGRILPKSKTM